jgi:predicted SprT family Zn-dependent metalloprotease
VCITNSGSSAEPVANELSPTEQITNELQTVYKTFNAMFFEDRLPPCLISLQPRAVHIYGYHSADRFGSNTEAKRRVDEIALNPVHFGRWNLTEVLQTFAHEMVHGWQHHFGKPSRRGYHNREWAAKMKSIGLHPSSTGKPGGAETGQHMSDYLIPGGALETAIEVLIENGFGISWYDRLAELLAEFCPDEEIVAGFGPDNEPPAAAGIPGEPLRKSGTRAKFSCSTCDQSAWAKPRANLVCGDCRAVMLPCTGKRRLGRGR